MFRFVVAALAMACGVGAAAAQGFPSRPITLIVPFAAGGPTDTIARLTAQGMSQKLNQQVVVENVAGAGGTVALRRVAKSAADGYTLLISHINHASTATLYPKLDYDSVKDFAPIGLVTDGAMGIVANTAFAPSTMPDLLAHLRANPGRISYAHAGVGSGAHLCGLLLQSVANVKVTEVPYRGTGPALNDIVAGQVDLLCDQVTNIMGQIDGGRIKVYAVTSADRLTPRLKDVPTVRESGLKEFEITVWHGLYAPAGTPKAVIDTLNAALNVAITDPTFQARMGDLATRPATPAEATPAALQAKLEKEVAMWREVIGKAGITAN
jgi:tripartite-type tricarboxylate transporter receptor subunit TctC